jgi:hypothetical protein
MAFLLFLVAHAVAPEGAVAYRCLDDTTFTLSISQTAAIVRFKDGEYRLPRRPSALATKYATRAATLYLDGDFAAFVADDRPLPGCFRVKPSPAPPPAK